MTREALGYIQRNYLHETVIKYPDRAEATRVWNFPYVAIEEAVVNAIYHRSYEEREPIEVRISHDELAVVSFSGLDRSIRLEDLQAGRAVSRRYRNRRIGEFLKELDLTEGRSTGVPKIFKEMAANGSPPPGFETDDDRISFVIRLLRHPLAKRAMTADEEVTGQVTEEVERLLRFMTGEMSRTMRPCAPGYAGKSD
jgi:ATP-dependent DNA helicase RecG